jgi:hypothetical protein
MQDTPCAWAFLAIASLLRGGLLTRPMRRECRLNRPQAVDFVRHQYGLQSDRSPTQSPDPGEMQLRALAPSQSAPRRDMADRLSILQSGTAQVGLNAGLLTVADRLTSGQHWPADLS